MMAQISWPDPTTLVAIYGAVLATYTLLKERREKRRILKVTLTNAIPVYATYGTGDPLLMIGAVNPGDRVVHLSGAGFKIARQKGGFAIFEPQSDVHFPHALEEGKGCKVWLESAGVAKQLKSLGHTGTVRLVGYFQDAIGTQYYSKPLKFDVDEWSKAASAG